MIREEHTPARLQTYGSSHQVHHWVNVGMVSQNGIMREQYKCSGCPATKFIHPQRTRTFP